MNPTRLPKVIFAITAVFTIAAAAVWLWQREKALHSYEARIVARIAANHDWLTSLRLKEKLTPIPSSNATATAARLSIASQRSEAAPKDYWIVATMEALPEYQPYGRMQNQRFAIREFGDWFRQVNVTPERLAVLKQAIADAIEKRSQRYDRLLASGVDANTPAYRDGFKAIDQAMDAGLKQVLTSDEYASLGQFKRAQNWNNYLPEMDAFFEDRGAPALTPEQRRAFLDASVDATKYTPEGPPLAPGPLFRMRNDRIAAIVAASLPADQRQALLDYVAFFNQRSKLTGEILNPSAPDETQYTGGKAF